MVAPFEAMDRQLGISFDRFIRTTDDDHKALCAELWQRMAANGDLYLDRYEGWYSVRDEAYYDESELVDAEDSAGQKIRLSPQGTPVEWTVEESWFFKLSAYADKLLALYESNPDFIQPASRRNEMRSFVAQGLRDLSMSRTSFDWGVPVPGSPGHVMYVWVDALANYLTGAGGLDGEWWPADLHVVGKDVMRFHTIYWPAFLMSARLALPKTVFGHGHVLFRGEKMSKSLGNVVDPVEMATRFGVDRLRWFLCRDVAFGDDGSYSDEAIIERCNADLANGLGNLAQRALSIVAKDGGTMPAGGVAGEGEATLQAAFIAGTEAYFAAMDALALHRALEAVMGMVNAANLYFADAAPWALKNDPERRAAVLAAALDATRRLTLLVQPFIPESAAKLLDQLGVAADARDFNAFDATVAAGTPLPAPQGVFPRWTDTQA
jgi:methionyl-tRNA synthetase